MKKYLFIFLKSIKTDNSGLKHNYIEVIMDNRILSLSNFGFCGPVFVSYLSKILRFFYSSRFLAEVPIGIY